MNVVKQLLRNITAGWSEMVILLVSAAVIPPLLLTQLGKEGYGVWVLVGQTIAYLSILDLGVGSSIGRFVAKYTAKNDWDKISGIINSSIFLFLLSSILIVLVTLVLWPNFSRYFNLSQEYRQTGKWLIIMTGLGVAFNLPLRTGRGMLEGAHCFHLLYFYRAFGAFIKLVLLVVLFGFMKQKSLILLAVVFLVVSILPSVMMCFSGYRRLEGVSFGRKYVRRRHIGEIFSLSTSSLLITIANLLLNQGQVIAIGKIVGADSVAIYAIPIMLLTYGSMALAYIVGAFKPLASHMYALDKSEQLQKLNVKGVKILFALSLCIAISAIVFGKSFLKLWLFSTELRPEDYTIIYYVLMIMVSGFAVGSPQFITSKMLTGIDKHWFVAIISIGISVTGLIVGIILTKTTGMGLYGMAIGWTFVMLTKGVIVFPIVACRSFKIRPLTYFCKAYLPPLKAAVILVGVAYLLKKSFGQLTILTLLCSVVVCLIVYSIAVYFTCLEQNQKRRIRNIAAGLLSRFKT